MSNTYEIQSSAVTNAVNTASFRLKFLTKKEIQAAHAF